MAASREEGHSISNMLSPDLRAQSIKKLERMTLRHLREQAKAKMRKETIPNCHVGKWTQEESGQFETALAHVGRYWKAVAACIPTRTPTQVLLSYFMTSILVFMPSPAR